MEQVCSECGGVGTVLAIDQKDVEVREIESSYSRVVIEETNTLTYIRKECLGCGGAGLMPLRVSNG